jgi:hypothetical protein
MVFFSIIIVLVLAIAIIAFALTLRHRRVESAGTSGDALDVQASLHEMTEDVIVDECSTFVNPLEEGPTADWMIPDVEE